MPADARIGAGATEDDLGGGTHEPGWRSVMADMTRRTRLLFDEGRPVCDGVRGQAPLGTAPTWLGGTRILDRLEAAGYDVFANRPHLSTADAPHLAWQALTWRRRS